VASTWITTRTTASGGKRYRVEYRLGGREAPTRYGGSFKTRREADERKRWLSGERCRETCAGSSPQRA
jgi:hypothetical protein